MTKIRRHLEVSYTFLLLKIYTLGDQSKKDNLPCKVTAIFDDILIS